MSTEQTEEIVQQTQSEQGDRAVTTVRVYKDSQDELLELQVLAKRLTGAKPTQADVVEAALSGYRKHLESQQEPRS